MNLPLLYLGITRRDALGILTIRDLIFFVQQIVYQRYRLIKCCIQYISLCAWMTGNDEMVATREQFSKATPPVLQMMEAEEEE
jgi:hypothetical protein